MGKEQGQMEHLRLTVKDALNLLRAALKLRWGHDKIWGKEYFFYSRAYIFLSHNNEWLVGSASLSLKAECNVLTIMMPINVKLMSLNN